MLVKTHISVMYARRNMLIQLISHLLTHTGKFAEKSKLKRRLITHAGEKLFTCDVCQRAFKSKRELKNHL